MNEASSPRRGRFRPCRNPNQNPSPVPGRWTIASVANAHPARCIPSLAGLSLLLVATGTGQRDHNFRAAEGVRGMKFRKLGNTGLLVSELALGTMQFGGKMNM